MNIIQEIDRLYEDVREGEFCSQPIINEKGELEIFTYYAYEENNSLIVYDFGRLIKTDGTNIFVSETGTKGFFVYLKYLFKRFITFKVHPLVPQELENKLYKYYCNCLQKYHDEPSDENKRILRDAFIKLIPQEEVILYKKVSPWFIKMLGL